MGDVLKKHLTTSVRVLLVVLALFITGAAPVFAQNAQLPAGNGFQVSPVRQEIDLTPGSSQTFVITVENPSNSTITARPVVNNFLPSDDESGTPRLILDENVLPPANDFERLVQPLDEFDIPAGAKVNVTVTISASKTERAGGYYGAIRFIPILPGLDETQNVALTASVGTIFLVTIPGDLRQQLDLVQFSAGEGDSARGFFIGGDVNVLTRLRNAGDIHVQPYGKVQIRDMFNRLVHEFEFNDNDPRANVLPGSIRKFKDEIPQTNWIGRYSIIANLGYGSGGQLITTKTNFWYFSTPVFFALVFVLLVIVTAVYWYIRRLRKGTNRKNKHPY